MDLDRIKKKLQPYRYPLLILLLGLFLLLIPGGDKKQEAEDEDDRLRQILSEADGVGETRVLISEHGVLIVCEGAENARVKLDILRAIGSYTGFGSDKITILTLRDR